MSAAQEAEVRRSTATAALRRLAVGLPGDHDARAERLLERVAAAGPETRDALLWVGALALTEASS